MKKEILEQRLHTMNAPRMHEIVVANEKFGLLTNFAIFAALKTLFYYLE